MGFQQNVRATFYWKSFAKKASIVALALTFFTSLAIATESNPVRAYVDLFIAALLVGVVFYFTTKPQVNVFGGTSWYRLGEVWRPILLGLALVAIWYGIMHAVFAPPSAPADAGTKARDVLFWAILVGFVEEYVRWTWLQTLPYSPLVANALWVMLHPQVAVVFSGQPPNWFFALFAFLFGLLMTAVMYLYETPMRWGANRWLGPVLAATLHAGFNALVVLWTLEIVIPTLGTTPFGPMSLFFGW